MVSSLSASAPFASADADPSINPTRTRQTGCPGSGNRQHLATSRIRTRDLAGTNCPIGGELRDGSLRSAAPRRSNPQSPTEIGGASPSLGSGLTAGSSVSSPGRIVAGADGGGNRAGDFDGVGAAGRSGGSVSPDPEFSFRPAAPVSTSVAAAVALFPDGVMPSGEIATGPLAHRATPPRGTNAVAPDALEAPTACAARLRAEGGVVLEPVPPYCSRFGDGDCFFGDGDRELRS